MRGLVPLALVVLASSASWALKVDDIEVHSADVERYLSEAKEWLHKNDVEASLNGTGHSQAPRCKFAKRSAESTEMGRQHAIYQKALEMLIQNHNVSKHAAHRVLRQTSTVARCPQPRMSCVNSRYRTFDGSCNNINNPWWGMAGTAQARLFGASYEDGYDVPRGGFNSYLPSARLVSSQAHPDVRNEFPPITNMVPQFGQFLDHDISLTPEEGRQCCSNGGQDCWPILVSRPPPASAPAPKADFLFNSGVTCLDFTRSTPCINPSIGAREQINMNTAFIDGSQIYGSSNDRNRRLRNGGQRGQLVINTSGSPSLRVPFVTQTSTQTQGAFSAGDDRINEMPGLAVMHNLWLNEHNRIAKYIASRQPSWTDDQVFQETRRIVIAELQVITYKEYLPVVLGPSTMNSYGLTMLTTLPAAFTSYNPSVDPTVLNSFSTAAYRFGHTLISEFIQQINSQTRQVVNTYDIKDHYNQPQTLTLDSGRGADYTLTSLLETACQVFDQYVVEGVTNFLFGPPNNTNRRPGGDLVARNIQRGRDHGLPPFNAFRRYFGLAPLTSTSNPADLVQGQFPASTILGSLYKGNYENIDLFSGGLYERPANGGLSGQTFQYIKAEQFKRLKYGDRYFVTHRNQAGSFTDAQLEELLRRRLSDVICENGNGFHPFAQLNAFYQPSSSNPRLSCSDSSRVLNLNLFA